MSESKVGCDCGAVEIELAGEPRVRAYCHCESCRFLHNVPVMMLAAWPADAFLLVRGADTLSGFEYPGMEMERFWCSKCGASLYNTNRFDFRVVSQMLLRKRHGGELPNELIPDKHIFYSARVVDIADPLPKYLEGVDGPLFEA